MTVLLLHVMPTIISCFFCRLTIKIDIEESIYFLFVYDDIYSCNIQDNSLFMLLRTASTFICLLYFLLSIGNYQDTINNNHIEKL